MSRVKASAMRPWARPTGVEFPALFPATGKENDDDPRAESRTDQPAGDGRHRVHRVRHFATPGAGERPADDGIRAGRAAPFARSRALSAGPDEPDRQRASGRAPRTFRAG